ncbi:protein NDNF isoform X2 [Microplitis mediator]|uniref:protein NDNF isoform X2 n=1 Tax=Microplitis mediator TaxID=375433 RepID=UPI0025547127|nr:protein NDNF isoform X2 [Microplitis mediator]
MFLNIRLIIVTIILTQRKNLSARGEDALQIRQTFNQSNNNNNRGRESINKTDMLYPEHQIPAIIQPGNVSKFYYLSHRDGHPLTLIVTPCTGAIQWTVNCLEAPPDNRQGEAESAALTRWPVNALIPGSPLFSYQGDEAQNFTIPRVRAGLYRLEIKTTDITTRTNIPDRSPKTVLLYATSSALDHLPVSYESTRGKRHRALRFQPRRNRRRLTVSWSKSHVDPHMSNYCLAVTSGPVVHPPTLCAAQNVLETHSRPIKSSGSSREHQHRGNPEGLHCFNQTKLTLHGLKYNTTYDFTLYVVSTRNNVSTRISTESFKFRRTPAQVLRTGRYVTANLRKYDGFMNFQYQPPHNGTTEFYILPCGGGIVRAKLRGPSGFIRKKEVVGHASLKAPSLEPGSRYILGIYATPQELIKVSSVKVLATQEGSVLYPEQVPTKSAPREYRSLRKCHEVTVGVESAGAAKYCVLVRELRGASSVTGILSIPDQCGLHRRRRSEYTLEQCEDKTNPPDNRALLFTIKRLQPAKAYLVQITAQIHGQSLSYPLIDVHTRRCQL